ncbi:piggyBac transposable element-derived protein 4 [Caerostris darwini]|uniref:PiggyBac transposable element-derived protein 4 n=1 Tax=Caerostris darwini TaxID=1538125 RepID=A0AAV4VMX9_9ARAC|nr:piggyBac transposable element-derived protein 4 [Caerostris darwini]
MSPVPCPRFKFSGIPSVHVQFDDTSDVLQFYETFIDFSLMSKILEETNKYAKQCIQSSVARQFSESKFWVETTVEELHVFFALNILQGIVKKPGIDHYWSKRYSTNTPFFSKIMSHRRLCLLQRYLHFSDNAAFDPQNHECPKLVKVWPVLKHLNEKFSETVTPERDVIDESLMLFKGQLGWKQFIPLKRARFGVKCFMLCESISGYVWSIIIYTGKDTILKPEYSKLCFSSQIVLTMMEPLLHKGYCLTIDNYYSSPELADKLVSCRTDTYGTLNLKRKEVPKEMQKKKLKKGEIIAFQRGKVTVMKWMDKKKVSLLSTIHNTEMEQIQVRSETKEKPKILKDYNNTMGGVDRMDQNLKSFEIIKKRGKKCYRKIFFHIFDIAVWNSYIVYRKNGGKNTQLEFRLDLIDRVIEKYHSGLNFHRGRPDSEPNPLRLTETLFGNNCSHR